MAQNPRNSSPSISLPHSEKTAPAGARIVGSIDAGEQISVSLILKRMQPLNQKQLGEHRLTRAEYAKKHGADPAAIAAVHSFATQHGLIIDAAASSAVRRTVVLRGSAEAMERAFGTDLNRYEYQDADGREQQFRGREGALSIPADLAGVVEAVLGLDNRPQAAPHFRKIGAAGTHASAHARSAASSQSYTPNQIARFYNYPTDATGAGETIGIIELGGGYSTTDLQQYFTNLGMTPPNVVAVSVDGATSTPSDPNGPDGEVMLDIEVASAVAQGAKIVMYFAPNTDQGFLNAITTAIHDSTNNPSVISISWGSAEANWTQQAMLAMDNACQSAATLGITITAASGDNGSSDGVTDNANHVDFPSSSPHVLACGGTTLRVINNMVVDETVWNNTAGGGGATGGGVSNIFALPDYQQNANVPAATTGTGGRGIPDVAGDADPQTGYHIQVDGQQGVFGGTSAVAPLWAGLIALLNQKRGQSLGFLNPMLYANAGAMRDITSGNNGSFTAAAGWDACTGLGSPNGIQLETALTQHATQTQSTMSGSRRR